MLAHRDLSALLHSHSWVGKKNVLKNVQQTRCVFECCLWHIHDLMLLILLLSFHQFATRTACYFPITLAAI